MDKTVNKLSRFPPNPLYKLAFVKLMHMGCGTICNNFSGMLINLKRSAFLFARNFAKIMELNTGNS